MTIIVQKYGGSSVADTSRLKKVAAKVVETRRAGHDVVVVVSAMGNTTNDLLERSREVHPDASRRELDMLLSVGERISMSLLSMAIQAEGYEAISLTGSQSGIITNDAHANARIIDVRPFRIQDELLKGKIVIVAGYQGTSYKREITTLGRGGSDTTAVALAGALGAEVCEIYSDVDGIYSSDPRVVLDAQRLSSISYEEMLALSRHGAKVLNAEAVAFAQRHKIALHARSTHAQHSPGTVIRPDGWPENVLERAEMRPRGVASLASVIRVSGAIQTNLHEEIAACMEDAAVLSASYDFGARRFSCIINPTRLSTPDLALAALKSRLPEMEVDAETASVSLIGQDIEKNLVWGARLMASLSKAGISPLEMHTGPHAIMVLVPTQVRDEAMRAAHMVVTQR